MLISSSDAKQFHRLYQMLLQYTAASILDPKKRKDLNHRMCVEKSAEAAIETREILFADPKLIGRYVAENPDKLDDDELEIVRQWQNFKIGQFIIDRDLKSHTIFLSTEGKSEAFGVLGLTTEVDEILRYQPLPAMVKTVLLQWKGRIVHDGYFAAYSVSFGPGIRRSFREQYTEAKSQGIVTTFLDENKNGRKLAVKVQAKNGVPIKNPSNTSREGLIELKIVLNQVTPMVWRKVILDPKITLYDLHFLIQKVMGWDDSHLHSFSVGKNARTFAPHDLDYGDFEDYFHEDSETVTLHDLIAQGYKKVFYTYDFGDSWKHTLTFGNKFASPESKTFPRCTDGAGACPPDDSGGAWDYMKKCEVLADPENEEYEETRLWLGEDFDPLKFSIDDVNESLNS